jgi:hypothetical protein
MIFAKVGAALLLILPICSANAAGGRSCFGTSCRDKIIDVAECIVSNTSNLRLRSLPSVNSQAVGDVSDGATAYVADQKGAWVFVQTEETFEGKTERTDGGWLPRSALTHCRDDRK